MAELKKKQLINGIHRLLDGDKSLAGLPKIDGKDAPVEKVLESAFVELLAGITYREDLYTAHIESMEHSTTKAPDEKEVYVFVKGELENLKNDPVNYGKNFKERFNEAEYRIAPLKDNPLEGENSLMGDNDESQNLTQSGPKRL